MSSDQVAALREAMRAEVAHVVAVVVTEAVANLQEATPVKTGWARANWIPSVGTPETGVDGAPPKDGKGAAQTSGMADAGLARVVRYTLDDGDAYVANNVPYISRLNGGSSTQAPADFVERSIDAAVQTIGDQLLSRKVDL